MGISDNTVNPDRQVYDCFVETYMRGGSVNVLFIGNSITRHLPKPEIGWHRDCGMAASSPESDYLHIVLRGLEKQLGRVNYCVAQLGRWEKQYWDDGILLSYVKAREFAADIIICRLGENIWGSRDMLEEQPLYPKFDGMLKYFNAKPASKVAVTDLFWAWDDIDKPIRKVVSDNGYTQVYIGDLGARSDCKALDEYEHHGVSIHPNDLGMQNIAGRILRALGAEAEKYA